MSPALLTRMSTSLQDSASAVTCPAAARSPGWIAAVTPCCLRNAAATSPSSAALRAARWRLQPSAARDRAIASPMPREAPVTRAVRPLRLRSIALLKELEDLARQRRAHDLGGTAG